MRTGCPASPFKIHCTAAAILQSSRVGIHFQFQLASARPRFRISLARRIKMHFVTRDAGEFAPAKTGRGLYCVEFSPGHANHPIAPESILEKVRLGAANEILL